MSFSVFSRAAGIATFTAAGQLIVIATLPLYSRLFEPAAYGDYLIFVGTVAILSVLGGLRYDSAIVLPRDDYIAAQLSMLVMVIASGAALLIATATLLVDIWHRHGPHINPINTSMGFALAVATILSAAQRCLASWCIRRNRFLLIGVALFLLSLITVVMQLLLVHWMAPLDSLVYGYVCALGVQCFSMATMLGRLDRYHCQRLLSIRGLRVVAKKYSRFPKYMVGYALASSARDRLIQIVLGLGAGADAVGRFGLAYRVVFAPNSLIYSAVSPIFYGMASRSDGRTVSRFAAGLVEASFIGLAVPYAAFAIEAPALTDEVLSQKWHGTGPFIQALSCPALFMAATCWLDRAFDCFRRQRAALTLEASFTVSSVAVVAFLSMHVDPLNVARAFAALSVVYYFSYFATTFIACAFPMKDFKHACVTAILASAVTLAFCLSIHAMSSVGWRWVCYALLMTGLIVSWLKYRNGVRILRLLSQ